MARLEAVSLERLRAELDTLEDRRPMQRLMAAIIYKQGPSVPMIADWFDIRPATVYAWFDRIESEESLNVAIHDAPRSGRPPRLTSEQRRELFSVLGQSPAAAGLAADDWSPELVQEFVSERYQVTYSRRHIRRLMNEADSRNRIREIMSGRHE